MAVPDDGVCAGVAAVVLPGADDPVLPDVVPQSELPGAEVDVELEDGAT